MTTTRSSFSPLARILVVLALIHFQWPGLGVVFSGYFSRATTPLLAIFAAPNVHLHLAPALPPSPPWNVMVDASDVVTRQAAGALLDVRRVGWLPLGAFAALIAAFPIQRWKSRAAVAALGLTFIHALWVLPVLASFGDSRAGFFKLGDVGYTLVVVAQRALVTLPGMAYALPALLWFVLTWRFERELV